MHDCPNQKMIDQLQKTVISGNGEPSLLVQVKGLTTEMRGVRDDIKEYMERQEALIKEFGITNREFYNFKSATDATNIEKEKQAGRNRWVIGTMVVVVIALVGWVRIDMKETREKQATLETRQNYDSYDLMLIMDTLNLKLGTRGADSLNIDL